VAVIVLFALMFMIMLSRVYLPKAISLTGKKLFEVRLTYVERLILHRINLYAIGAVLVLLTVTGTITNGLQLVVILATQAILLVPTRVAVLSDGIALNRALFRPWSDFSGYTTDARRITLAGKPGVRALHLPVLAEHQQELASAVGRHLPRIQARKEARSEHQVTVS
jgi:hypothetical protein